MKSRLKVGIRCTKVSEICVETPWRVGAKSGVETPTTLMAESSTACAVSCASTRVASDSLTSIRSRLNGWNPMARMATVYGPPTSRPWIRYWPLPRVRPVVVKPLPRFVTCTAASATGWPCGSVTFPVIAPVVTPWAGASPMKSSVKTAAATRARPEPTIQRMDGPLLGRELTGRNWSRWEEASRTLGGCFTQQIHGGDANENVRRPRGQRRGQHPSRADGFGELKHQQHDESRGEARRDTPGRAALGTRDRERRAEQRNQETDERNRDLERKLDLQLLGIRAAPGQRIDVASQLAVAHFVRRLRLGEQIHRPLGHGTRLQRIELERSLATGLVAGQVPQRPPNQGPARPHLAAVAVHRALGGQYDRRIRRAGAFALQHQVRHLARPQLERANCVHPAAVGAIHEVVARAGGPDRFLAQHLEATRRGHRRDFAEQRDEKDAQPLAQEVPIEGPQGDLHKRFRIFPTQPNSVSFSSSQSPPCAVLPARRTDRSRGIATIRKMRFGVHIAKNGGTISRSPNSSPPMRPT